MTLAPDQYNGQNKQTQANIYVVPLHMLRGDINTENDKKCKVVKLGLFSQTDKTVLICVQYYDVISIQITWDLQ